MRGSVTRAAEGFELPSREIPALGALVAEVRKKVGAAPEPVTSRSTARSPRSVQAACS